MQQNRGCYICFLFCGRICYIPKLLVCNKSHIGEVTLKERPYKDLGSPTLTTSFWDVILQGLMLVINGVFIEIQLIGKGYLRKVLASGRPNRDRVKRC